MSPFVSLSLALKGKGNNGKSDASGMRLKFECKIVPSSFDDFSRRLFSRVTRESMFSQSNRTKFAWSKFAFAKGAGGKVGMDCKA